MHGSLLEIAILRCPVKRQWVNRFGLSYDRRPGEGRAASAIKQSQAMRSPAGRLLPSPAPEFSMRPQVTESDRHSRLLAASLLWLLIGSVLLATTLVPAHTELLGWTPMFWLLCAPLVVALTLEPSLPRQLLALCRPRRRHASRLIWH
jgi:hypothetical protein